jgi:hypothetical protein
MGQEPIYRCHPRLPSSAALSHRQTFPGLIILTYSTLDTFGSICQEILPP